MHREPPSMHREQPGATKHAPGGNWNESSHPGTGVEHLQTNGGYIPLWVRFSQSPPLRARAAQVHPGPPGEDGGCPGDDSVLPRALERQSRRRPRLQRDSTLPGWGMPYGSARDDGDAQGRWPEASGQDLPEPPGTDGGCPGRTSVTVRRLTST